MLRIGRRFVDHLGLVETTMQQKKGEHQYTQLNEKKITEEGEKSRRTTQDSLIKEPLGLIVHAGYQSSQKKILTF
jgi:hypothetical protein